MTSGDKVLGRNIKKSKEKRESWGDERAGQVLFYTYRMIMEGLFDKVTGEQRPEGSERSCRFWRKGFLGSEISSAEVLRSILRVCPGTSRRPVWLDQRV